MVETKVSDSARERRRDRRTKIPRISSGCGLTKISGRAGGCCQKVKNGPMTGLVVQDRSRSLRS
jgi:hypothetical protein